MIRGSRFAFVFFATLIPSFSQEIVHLVTGFELQATSHTRNRDTFLLRTEAGTVELPATEIGSIEVIPEPIHRPSATYASQVVDTGAVIRAAAALQSSGSEFIRLVGSVAQVESGLRQEAVSVKGATGLMQLMPNTARALDVVATDMEQNVRGGATYLRQLLLQYNNNSVLALAAYNAGPGAVAKYGGVPPYLETRRYIGKVLREYARQSATRTLNQ